MLPKLLIASFLSDSVQTELLLWNLQPRNLDKCIAGVKELKATPKEMTDPAVSDALIKLVQRKSSDPQW